MRLSNIASTFNKCRKEHRPALLTYTVSGDPNKKKSFEILKSISDQGLKCHNDISGNEDISNPKVNKLREREIKSFGSLHYYHYQKIQYVL